MLVPTLAGVMLACSQCSSHLVQVEDWSWPRGADGEVAARVVCPECWHTALWSLDRDQAGRLADHHEDAIGQLIGQAVALALTPVQPA